MTRLFLLLLVSTAACAVANNEQATIAHEAMASLSEGDGDGLLPLSVAGDPPPAPAARPWTPPLAPPLATMPAADPPEGADRDCLQALTAAGVPFATVGYLRGVRTPVEIVGPIQGIRLLPRVGRAALMDCALARALVEAVPLFQQFHVSALSFSGAYDYRNRAHSRELSQHAHGLAIDVHALETSDGWYDVERHYARDSGRWRVREAATDGSALASCVGPVDEGPGRLLRTLACSLQRHPAFRLILGPDDNFDHRNHFHLEAPGDGPEPQVASAPPPPHRVAARAGVTAARARRTGHVHSSRHRSSHHHTHARGKAAK